MSQEDRLDQPDDRCLVFRLGDELYATPLLQVREVVGYLAPKAVPNSHDSFLGVINIRGEIVGVIDLRVKLGHAATVNERTCLLVFEVDDGVLAAVVDSVESVTKMADDQIDRQPKIKSKINLNYMLSIAKSKGGLVTIIDMQKVLDSEDILIISKHSKIAA